MSNREINKVFGDARTALADLLFDGMSIMADGFGACGIPDMCIQEVRRRHIRNLTVISNNCGGEYPEKPGEGFGLCALLKDRLVKRAIASYIGSIKTFENQYLDGSLDLSLTPQGTLAELIRAGGPGTAAFYTPTGVGTVVTDGKELRDFSGQTCVLEQSLTADLSLVKAWKADYEGNLIHRKTACNFNPVMATAGRVTVAEVEELVPTGEIDPDAVHTPGIYDYRLFEGTAAKKIEQRTVRQNGDGR